jgi:LysR family hydrogen peroxide-inducible transcriptional activator
MTLVQLEYIVALNNQKHFARAAAACHITQPSLSMQVQKLEQDLGVQIFVRTSPVETTEIGLVIVEQARKVLAEVSAVRELVEQDKGVVGGSIKLGIIPTLAPYLLPQFIQAFTIAHKAVRLSIHELTTEAIVSQLKNGSLDAGIMATPLNNAALKEEFLFNEEFVAYVSQNEKIFSKKYLMPCDIDINSMWLLEEGHCLRNQVMNLCGFQKNSSLEKHVDYAASSIETLKRFVNKNGGITLLPELATLDLQDEQKDMLRYFKSPAPVREISLIALKSFPKTRLLILLKKSILENLPPQVLQKRNVRALCIT